MRAVTKPDIGPFGFGCRIRSLAFVGIRVNKQINMMFL